MEDEGIMLSLNHKSGVLWMCMLPCVGNPLFHEIPSYFTRQQQGSVEVYYVLHVWMKWKAKKEGSLNVQAEKMKLHSDKSHTECAAGESTQNQKISLQVITILNVETDGKLHLFCKTYKLWYRWFTVIQIPGINILQIYITLLTSKINLVYLTGNRGWKFRPLLMSYIPAHVPRTSL